MINQMYKSLLDQDRAPVVICDLAHTILYMNRAASRHYAKWGGEALIGRSLLGCHNAVSRESIAEVLAWFGERRENNMIFTSRNDGENKDVYMVALRDVDGRLIGYTEKHEYRDAETAELYDFSQSLV